VLAIGRPSIPIETYLRLMFLKFRYRLGYETLCREVAASIGWQRFCRIPLGGRTPHPTTLMKITTRCGPEVVAQPNEALMAKAVEARLAKPGCGWTPLWLKPTSSIPPIPVCRPRPGAGSGGW
jgi:IS5 family transposase